MKKYLNPLEEKIKKLINLNSLTGAIAVTALEDLNQNYEQAFIFLPLIGEYTEGGSAVQLICEIISQIEASKKEIVLIGCDCCFPDIRIRGQKNRFWMLKVSQFLSSLLSGTSWVSRVYSPGYDFGPEGQSWSNRKLNDGEARMEFRFGFPPLTKDQFKELQRFSEPNYNYIPEDEREFTKELLA